MTISLLLERNPKFRDPAWRGTRGESAGTSALSIHIDAMTGDYLGRIH